MTQKIHIHQFPNGLTLLAEEMDWLESAAFNLILPAGCIYEQPNQAGLGNLTCEMVERGAGERDSRKLVSDLENLGCDSSGSCGLSHTSFGGAMPAESLPAVLSIFADICRKPHFPEEQFEDARASCLQEVASVEDEPAQKTMLRLRQQFYGDPFGRTSLGKAETLSAVTLSDAKAFWQRNFHPQNAILSLAGKVDFPRLRDHVEALFANWQPQPIPEIAEVPPERGFVHLPAEITQSHMGIAFPGLSYADPDYFLLRGAVGVLSDGMSSRLFTEVREKRGLSYTVYATCQSLRDRGAVVSYAGPEPQNAQITLDVMLAEFRRLAEGVEADELARLKGRIKRAIILQQESSSSRASSIASDWYFLKRVRTMEELNTKLDELTHTAINKYLAEHPPSNFTVVSMGPEPVSFPSAT